MTAHVRDHLDRFYTPDAVADALVRLLPIDGAVLEPSVGGGAFVRAVRAHHQLAQMVVMDVDPTAPGLAMQGPVEFSIRADFLARGFVDTEAYDWVIGNPPYRDAEAHIRRALGLATNVAFLLRLGILASRTRLDLWREHPARKVWVLAERPSFTADGKTDGHEYAWIWWDREHRGPTELEVVSWRGAR